IIDAGRLGLEGWPRPLVTGADLTLLVLRSNLPALAGARSWAASLAADAIPGHAVQAVLVGEGRPYRAAEVSRAIRLPVLSAVGWDPRRAEVFSDGAAKPVPRLGGSAAADRAFESSGYLRSLRAVGEAAAKLASTAGDRSLLRDMIAARTSQGART
ncbi:MAG: hypothetical protein IT193_08270, partial [Propionibacteriaceae bacterium]|nr:hypothetical protein [Propionibacteriaceae bacterium]